MQFTRKNGIWLPITAKTPKTRSDLCDEEYYRLLKGMIDISHGVIPADNNYYRDAEGLLLKVFYHSATISYITKGTDTPDLDKNFLDPATPTIVARATLEAALTFYYIYCHPVTPEQRCLHYEMWIYKGLVARHKREPHYISIPQGWKEEVEEIKNLRANIEKNVYFQKMDQRKRSKNISDSDWRVYYRKSPVGKFKRPEWSEIAEFAGISKGGFEEIYSFLCDYGHSSYRSIMQIHQAKKDEDKYILLQATINFVKIAMALIIKCYAQLMPRARDKFENDLILKDLVDLWLEIAATE